MSERKPQAELASPELYLGSAAVLIGCLLALLVGALLAFDDERRRALPVAEDVFDDLRERYRRLAELAEELKAAKARDDELMRQMGVRLYAAQREAAALAQVEAVAENDRRDDS